MRARRLGYRPELDGIRAVAIAGVLATHGDFPLVHGGFVGVDVFFVLSGFLITTLLLEEKTAAGSISLGKFYARRFLRLMPALVAVVLIATAVGWFAMPSERPVLAKEAIASLTYTRNLVSIPVLLLGHTWSLALEEQFYLVWPPILAVALARRRAGAVAVAVVVAIVLLAALRTTGLEGPLGILESRPDAPLVGVAAAFVYQRKGALRSVSTAAACAAMLVVLFWLLNPLRVGLNAFEHGGYTIVHLATAAVILAAVGQPANPVTSLLRLSPLAFIGRYSYGIYLWHVPVYVLVARNHGAWPGPAVVAAKLVLTALAAAASYLLIERRFLRRKERYAVASTSYANTSSNV